MGISDSSCQKERCTLCLCIDYRKLNLVTQKDAYPLPHSEDALQALSGSQWFSTIDLLSGYWQVSVAGNDKEKTASQHKRVCFNLMLCLLVSAMPPTTFQRLMDLNLSGML